MATIGENAFMDCRDLKSVTFIPGSLRSLGDNAFAGCGNLVQITLPDTLLQIGNGVFSGCTTMVSITIPQSVTAIGESVFYRCLADLVIRGVPGSYAANYAVENNMDFEPIGGQTAA